MVDDVELLFERRDSGACLLDQGALLADVVGREAAGLYPLLDDVELLLLQREHLAGEIDLRAQLRLANGRRDDVAGEHQASAFQLPVLILRQRVQTFDEATIGSEQIERVGDCD